MTMLDNDITTLCRERPGHWTQEGIQNVLERNGCQLRVSAAGMKPCTRQLGRSSWIQVSARPDNHPKYASIPFFRELSFDGITKDEKGNPGELKGRTPEQWLRESLRQAFAWIDSQRVEDTPDDTAPDHCISGSFWDDD